MLEIKNLFFGYDRNNPVLKGIDMSLEEGQVGILLGCNGAGKTTLFKIMTGVLKPDGGKILFDGQDLLQMPRRQRAGIVAYVPQQIDFGALTVYQSVLTGRVSYYTVRPSKKDLDVVDEILCEMGLDKKSCRDVQELSGGERQKVAIARALAQQPRVLVFDEPTGNLDIANELLIINEAKKIAHSKGITVISSIHDLNQAMFFGDKFFFMKDGIIKYFGGPEIFDESIIKDIYGVSARVVTENGEQYIRYYKERGNE
ncbi:MAG: ABC transporter ATP-binding protein [Spirochaetales bacterium]|nr:ABC transporter ATP-binding protein [Spirochaetales bacterium]